LKNHRIIETFALFFPSHPFVPISRPPCRLPRQWCDVVVFNGFANGLVGRVSVPKSFGKDLIPNDGLCPVGDNLLCRYAYWEKKKQ